MSKQDVQENENLATYWRRKLEWYTTEATAEEYDEEEVRAIRAVLKMVESEGELDESYYNAEKSLQRFRDTLDIRMRIQDEMRRTLAGEVSLADYPEDEEAVEAKIEAVSEEAGTVKKIAKRRLSFRTNGFRKLAMVASLVMALVIGGTVGAYAQKEGFFHDVNTNKDKDAVITSPTNFEIVPNKYTTYEDVNDIPISYVRFVFMPIRLPDDMSFQVAEIAENDYSIRTKSKFVNDDKNYVYAYKKSFKEIVVANDQLFDGFEFLCKKSYENIDVQYFVKKNEDYTEYVAFFEHENCTYTLNANLDFETIESIIEQNILTKNF